MNTQNDLSSNEASAEVTQVKGTNLLKDGFSFKFEVDQHVIDINCSAKSGKESIYLDGELVSQKRSFRRKSLHELQIDGVQYEVEFNVASMMTGELHCTLIKEGVHVATQKQVPKEYATKDLAIKRVIIGFIAGALFGYFAMKLLLDTVLS